MNKVHGSIEKNNDSISIQIFRGNRKTKIWIKGVFNGLMFLIIYLCKQNR